MPLDKFTVACASLSGDLYIARIGKKPGLMLDKRKCEPEFMRALVEHMTHDSPKGSTRKVSFDGGKTSYEVSVKPI